MNDAVLSVRVSEDIKRQFTELAKHTGINNKDFMENLLKNYEVSKEVQEQNIYYSDLSEMQNLTSRMYDIYINMVEKSKLIEKKKEGELRTFMEQKENQGTELKNQIDELDSKLKKSDDIKLENNRLREELKRITEENESLRSLNTLMKEKLNKQTEDLNNSKELEKGILEKEQQISKINEQYEKLKREYDTQGLRLESKMMEFERFKEDIHKRNEELMEKHKMDREFIDMKHETELTQVKYQIKESMLEKANEEQKEYQMRINDFVIKVSEKDSLISRLEKESIQLNDIISKKEEEKKSE